MLMLLQQPVAFGRAQGARNSPGPFDATG